MPVPDRLHAASGESEGAGSQHPGTVPDRMVPGRARAEENISTARGILLRWCRSVQAKGTSALLKKDFAFRRFLTAGLSPMFPKK